MYQIMRENRSDGFRHRRDGYPVIDEVGCSCTDRPIVQSHTVLRPRKILEEVVTKQGVDVGFEALDVGSILDTFPGNEHSALNRNALADGPDLAGVRRNAGKNAGDHGRRVVCRI